MFPFFTDTPVSLVRMRMGLGDESEILDGRMYTRRAASLYSA